MRRRRVFSVKFQMKTYRLRDKDNTIFFPFDLQDCGGNLHIVR